MRPLVVGRTFFGDRECVSVAYEELLVGGLRATKDVTFLRHVTRDGKMEATVDSFGKWNVDRALNEDRSVFACSDDSGNLAVVKIPRRESLSILRRDEQRNREVLAYEAGQLSAWRDMPGVVKLIAWAPTASTPYLVTELLGPSLEESIPQDGFDTVACFRLIHDVAATLEKIHARHSAHHDVKPDNILQSASGHWTLIDPAPPELSSEEYGPDRFVGPPRDLVALGRVFITAYTGSMETQLSDEYIDGVQDLSGGDRWLKVLRRLLRGESSATDARRSTTAVLKHL